MSKRDKECEVALKGGGWVGSGKQSLWNCRSNNLMSCKRITNGKH